MYPYVYRILDHALDSSFLLSNTSLLNCSVATCTSTSPPMPFFQVSSSTCISAAALSCAGLLSSFSVSASFFASANSASKAFSSASSCQLLTNHEFLPYVSNRARFVFRPDRYVDEAYARRRVSRHCCSSSGLSSSDDGNVRFGGSRASCS